MNNTSTQRIRTFSALSLALLISGTSYASHKSELATESAYPHGYEKAPRLTSNCVGGPSAVISNLGSQPAASGCAGSNLADATAPVPIRLAKPLSSNPYMRSSDNIRYSF